MNKDLSNNINYIEEKNYSILEKNTDVWLGSLPFKEGDIFPTDSIKERALISNTNKLIYNNDVESIYANIISIFPEIDPMYGWQIREIITNLPYFKNSTNYWCGLVAGEPPLVDGDESIDIAINEVIDNSNFATTIQNEVRSRFMDIISAYRVDVDINGKPTIVAIEAKNLICYVSRIYTNSIEVNVVFNIYTDVDGQQYVEFIEYHYDGKIIKTVFKYNEGIIGKQIEKEETEAFNGKFKMSPIVVFKHNTINNEIYGVDQYRYWSASILGAMRELQNIFRLGERTREMIRKVPESSIKKDPSSGSSLFFNKGTISYPDGATPPDIEYIVPEIRMDEAIKAFDKAVKSVSIDTNLGPVFFDLEKLGTNLSAKSIEAALYPTKLEAKRITSEMQPSVKELVIKLCALVDIDLTNKSKFSIIWFDGFPQDIKDYTDAIQKRLGDKPSISLQDAIIKLDKVSSRVALQKAREIEAENKEKQEREADESKKEQDKVENITTDNLKIEEGLKQEVEIGSLNNHNISPIAGVKIEGKVTNTSDNTVWETQMYPAPRDISFEHSKGLSKRWIERKLRQKSID